MFYIQKIFAGFLASILRRHRFAAAFWKPISFAHLEGGNAHATGTKVEKTETTGRLTSQLEWLNGAGFSQSVIRKTILKLIKGAKSDWGEREKENKRKKPVVIPYLPKMSRGLKNVANRYDVNVANWYDVDVVFSAPNKLTKLCGKIGRMLSPNQKPPRKQACQVKHTSPLCVVQRVLFI